MPKIITFDNVYNYFKDEGCELLETEYINMNTKMRYICSCDNESVIRFYSFKNGNRCLKCSGKEKYSYVFVYNYFKDEGCELLETKYINNKTLMRYRCKCGEESMISFSNFKNHNKRCKDCGYKKTTGDNHYKFKKDRTRRRRSTHLQFDLHKLHTLSDDPNYNNHIQSQKVAKVSSNRWARSDYTVDHIHPRVAFVDNDLDKLYDPIIIKEICNLRENLRIIPKEENGSKAGKYNQEEFMNWFNEKLTVYHTI